MKRFYPLLPLLFLACLLWQESLPMHVPMVAQASASTAATSAKKVIIVGIDGLDPKILTRLMKAGKLPNFQLLTDQGGFLPLQTSMPPLSPVAWSDFITGMNAGGHGIFDFIHRDPQTLIPYLSTSKTQAATRTLEIGDWVIPLSAGSVSLLRHGKAFWQILEEHGIPATIVRVPANFPPVESSGQPQLSGMGTPDLQGTYGIFSFFTDEPVDNYNIESGGEIFPVRFINHHTRAQLLGPPNSFRSDARQTAVEFEVYVDHVNPVAKIVMQDHEVILQQGEWSAWLPVDFEMLPVLQSVRGMVRLYLKEVRPHFKLYVTPINIDPSDPALPLSTPESYAPEMCEEIGLFYTQGMPHDTNALSYGVLDDGEFLQQAKIVFEEHQRMFDRELRRFTGGFLFLYTDRVDQLAHMFWRTMDPQHPAYQQGNGYADVIENTYQDVDAVVGKVVQSIDDQTTLIVMSDHGFAPFYRAFHLNTWLQQEGYIQFKDASTKKAEGIFSNVDWKRTKAYGIGFNGLYVNVEGRELHGFVRLGAERDALLEEISAKLRNVKDPKTGQQAIAKVYRAEEIYTGAYLSQAPDLVIGYDRGYRVSGKSALGEFPAGLFEDNTDKWSGDHSVAADLVPGVLVANRRIQSAQPALYDLAPTILNEFGIAKGPQMVGHNIFQNEIAHLSADSSSNLKEE